MGLSAPGQNKYKRERMEEVQFYSQSHVNQPSSRGQSQFGAHSAKPHTLDCSIMGDEVASVTPSEYRSYNVAPPVAIHERGSEPSHKQMATGSKSVTTNNQHEVIYHEDQLI